MQFWGMRHGAAAYVDEQLQVLPLGPRLGRNQQQEWFRLRSGRAVKMLPRFGDRAIGWRCQPPRALEFLHFFRLKAKSASDNRDGLLSPLLPAITPNHYCKFKTSKSQRMTEYDIPRISRGKKDHDPKMIGLWKVGRTIGKGSSGSLVIRHSSLFNR